MFLEFLKRNLEQSIRNSKDLWERFVNKLLNELLENCGRVSKEIPVEMHKSAADGTYKHIGRRIHREVS